MRDMNLRDMKMRHHVAGVENARHENARSATVWNTECWICLSIAEQECMVKKGKVFPYSLPSVGPGADPGVQAVSPQVT